MLGKAEWRIRAEREGPGGGGNGARCAAAGSAGRGKALLDATSGNTGIAYAMLGAAWVP